MGVRWRRNKSVIRAKTDAPEGDCRATRVILSYLVFVIVFHSVIPASGDSAATAREAKSLIEESEGGPV